VDFDRNVAASLIEGAPGPVDSAGALAALEIIERMISSAGSPVA